MSINTFLYKEYLEPTFSLYGTEPNVSLVKSSFLSFSTDLLPVPVTIDSPQDNLDLFEKHFLNSAQNSIATNLIQPGLKYLGKSYLIYEKPPTYKLINCYQAQLHEITSDTPLTSYYLPIPWQLYIVGFDPLTNRTHTVRMYFMNSPLYSQDQPLYLPYIPNFYVSGVLCRPFFSSMEDLEKYSADVPGIIESSYDWVWSSNFNLDLTESISTIYAQKTPIQISRSIKDLQYINHRVTFSALHDTYSLIENLSISDVTSMQWPNPSLLEHYQSDEENRDISYEVEEYCSINNIDFNEEDFSCYDDFIEYICGHTDFLEKYPRSPQRVKTFSQILSVFLSTLSSTFSSYTFEKLLTDLYKKSISI